MPKRTQRKRTKGWRMPPNTVYVGRPTRWGNMWSPGKPVCGIVAEDWGCDSPSWFGRGAGEIVRDAAEAVDMYRKWIDDCARRNVPIPIAQLRGKNLACWCKPGTPCHADVLLKIANG